MKHVKFKYYGKTSGEALSVVKSAVDRDAKCSEAVDI